MQNDLWLIFWIFVIFVDTFLKVFRSWQFINHMKWIFKFYYHNLLTLVRRTHFQELSLLFLLLRIDFLKVNQYTLFCFIFGILCTFSRVFRYWQFINHMKWIFKFHHHNLLTLARRTHSQELILLFLSLRIVFSKVNKILF